jgi:uncharacterized membrane protein YqgA involved in biofilm formation
MTMEEIVGEMIGKKDFVGLKSIFNSPVKELGIKIAASMALFVHLPTAEKSKWNPDRLWYKVSGHLVSSIGAIDHEVDLMNFYFAHRAAKEAKDDFVTAEIVKFVSSHKILGEMLENPIHHDLVKMLLEIFPCLKREPTVPLPSLT